MRRPPCRFVLLAALCASSACFKSPALAVGGDDSNTSSSSTDGGGSAGSDGGCVADEDCDDGSPCTIDRCEAGACGRIPDASDPACACESAEDCSILPPSDDCRVRGCVGGTCTLQLSEAHTPVNDALQSEGDCQTVVCDGSGGMISIAEPLDVPVDGLECTVDACIDGAPSNGPAPAGTHCAAGECTSEGECFGCEGPGDCGGENSFCRVVTCAEQICGVKNTDAGTALPAEDQTAGDCRELRCDGAGHAGADIDDDDVPADDGSDCTTEACHGGVPESSNAPEGQACGIAHDLVCDGDGTCVGCTVVGDCPRPGTCREAACEANVCVTVALPLNTPCNDGVFCTQTDVCDGDGACAGTGNPCAGPDGDGNCRESCDEGNGNCLGNDPAGTPCNDTTFCNGTESCDASGECVSSGNPCDGPDGDSDCSEICREGPEDCNGNDPNNSNCGACSECNGSGMCFNQCGGLQQCCPGDLCINLGQSCE